MDVLPALETGVTSIRCLNRLRLIRQAAATTPGAEEFCNRFAAIEQLLTTPRPRPHAETDAASTQASLPA
jgi:hypothetical protein